MEARDMNEAAVPGINSDYARQAVAKWSAVPSKRGPIDMLAGIKNEWTRRATAILMENTVKEKGTVRALDEATTSGDIGGYTKQSLGVLRRAFPNLIAHQIVSIQPQTSKYGVIGTLDRTYTNTKGARVPAAGITNAPTAMGYDGKLTAGDNMSQNLAANYAREFIDYDDVCSDTGIGTAALSNVGANCRLPAWSPIRANGTAGQRTFTVKLFYNVIDGVPLARTATMNGAGNLIDQNSNVVGTFNITTGAWTLNALTAAGAGTVFVSNEVIYAQYYINQELIGQTAGARLPGVSIKMTTQQVQAEQRALTATWHPQAALDLQDLWGIDAAAEITTSFANEVQLETDRSIIDELIAGAYFQASYTYSASVPGEIESIRRMLTQINALGASIHRATQRGNGANFIVVGPAVAALLDQLSTHGDYASIEQSLVAGSGGPVTGDYGIQQVGTLLKKYAVFQNPYQNDTKVLVGYKGQAFYDAGYVYAPYAPINFTPTFQDPETLEYKQGCWTLGSQKLVRSDYYGVLTVSSLPTVTHI